MDRIAVEPKYESLASVLDEALTQAQSGKGKERHASGEEFEKQVICEVGRRVGRGYELGQAVKKIYESERLPGEAGVKELLGAINYLAAAIILRRESGFAHGALSSEKGLSEALKNIVVKRLPWDGGVDPWLEPDVAAATTPR